MYLSPRSIAGILCGLAVTCVAAGRPNVLLNCVNDPCGVPAPDGLAGVSLRPLLDDPNRPGKTGAISNRRHGRHVGSSLRTDRYRVVQYIDHKTKKPTLTELFDHAIDPNENTNMTEDQPRVVAALLKQLHAGKTALQ